MPTLRRILKYTPVVMMGLLMVLWVVSLTAPVGLRIRYPNVGTFRCVASHANVCATFSDNLSWYGSAGVGVEREPLSLRPYSYCLGSFKYQRLLSADSGLDIHIVWLPILFSITLILPLAIGPFTRFRFRLWHYLACTALVAVELAYYLRWQE
jgi:hypothetical protein